MKLPQCLSNQVSLNNERCCRMCPPGSGVTAACTATNDTQCEECEHNSSYSPRSSHTAPCQPCTNCPSNALRLHKCNLTHDTVCQCEKNYYWNNGSGRCKLCNLCPIGHGAWQLCEDGQNTICRRCSNGTFSDRTGLGACRPCRDCPTDWRQVKECNFRENTICEVKASTTSTFLHTAPTVTRDSMYRNGSDVIPVYCALLSAIVIGLVVYVIVVRLRRKKMRNSRACAGTFAFHQGASRPVGDGIMQLPPHGSDSGVFLENEAKVARPSPSDRVKDLSPQMIRTLESMFLTTSESCGSWRALARQLGYNSSRKALFRTRANRDNCAPVHYLIADWSRKHHATVGALQVALHKIGRDDVITRVFQSEAAIGSQPSFRRSRDSILGGAASAPKSGGMLGRSVSFNQVQKTSSVDIAAAQSECGKRPRKETRRSLKDQRWPLSVSLPGGQRLLEV